MVEQPGFQRPSGDGFMSPRKMASSGRDFLPAFFGKRMKVRENP